MEPMQAPEVKQHSRLRKLATTIGLAAVVFSGGYYAGSHYGAGKETNRLETLAKLPAAEGFLDVPNTYRVEVRKNSAGLREAYLQNLHDGTEVPLTEKSPRALASYQQNGTVLMDGAIILNDVGRWIYAKAGGEPAGERQFEKRE